MTTPKRILIAAIHYPVASGRYIARAFGRLGHDVRTVGPCTGNQIWVMTVDERHVWKPDFEGGGLMPSLSASNQAFVLNGWKPDLVITADSAYTLQWMTDCPHVVWGVDNHVRDYSMREFDHYFLAHHDGPALPVDENRSDTTWLPCAYDREYFTPSPIPMAEREYDVCMVGVAYPHRIEIIEAMRAAGLRVLAVTGALYEDYARAYQNSRISLCVSAASDLAQRVFETAAMGCVILSDPLADAERLKVPMATFHNTMDAVATAQEILRLPADTLDRLAQQSINYATPHTWDARAQVVLDTVFGGSNAA